MTRFEVKVHIAIYIGLYRDFFFQHVLGQFCPNLVYITPYSTAFIDVQSRGLCTFGAHKVAKTGIIRSNFKKNLLLRS